MLGGKVVVRQGGFRTIVAKQGTSTLGHAGLKISSMSCWPEFLSPSDAGSSPQFRFSSKQRKLAQDSRLHHVRHWRVAPVFQARLRHTGVLRHGLGLGESCFLKTKREHLD